MGEWYEETVLKRRYTNANRYIKKISITNHQTNAYKNHSEISSYPVKMVIIKKIKITRCWWGCREKGTVVHYWWQCNLIHPLWKTVWRFLKKTKNRIAVQFSNPTTGYLPKAKEINISKSYLRSCVYCSTIQNSKDMK